jgi:hypothetical protein
VEELQGGVRVGLKKVRDEFQFIDANQKLVENFQKPLISTLDLLIGYHLGITFK